MRSYDDEMGKTLSMVRTGNVDGALEVLESNNKSSDSKKGDKKDPTMLDSASGKDILYFFEKGELLRMKSDYENSRDAWLQADEIVRMWEDDYRINPTKVLGEIGASLVSDRLRRYDGQDYEKVFLSTKLMLDHMLLGNYDNARVEMKKTFERETLIKSFREKEYDKIQEEEKKRSLALSTDDLAKNGYPMDQLDGPEVLALKNGYQNAFAHYLSGFFFELKGEYPLSAPGYRNALALRPDSKLIQSKVDNVGKPKPGPNQADVLFVLESGLAPAWKSVEVPLPLPINKELVVVPLSFPTIVADEGAFVPVSLSVAGVELPVETLVNVDALARRQLKDQMPGIIGRTAIRGIIKAALQVEATKKAGKAAGLLMAIGGVAIEHADERSWRTLPARLSIARAILPRGTQRIEFRTASGTYQGTVTINDKINIIPIRIIGGSVFVDQQSTGGK
jgi:hypothetical protein